MEPRKTDWLAGYPLDLRTRATELARSGELTRRLTERYPEANPHTDNARLQRFVTDLKRENMKSSPPLGKIRYSDKIQALHRALGLHTYAVRQQGKNLKRKNELRVAALFKELPFAFLKMVVVHELAHLRHRDHDKAFYRLCEHMEPDYHRYETDLRLFLFARDIQRDIATG